MARQKNILSTLQKKNWKRWNLLSVRNKLRPRKNEYWCILEKEDPEFIACMDEKPYQLLGEAREPLPIILENDGKTDSEYVLF